MGDYKVAVAGLGAMGMGIAVSALRGGLSVTGCDISEEARAKFQEAGGVVAGRLVDAVADADALAVVVVNQQQMESVLFGKAGALAHMKPGSVVLGCATVPPAFDRAAPLLDVIAERVFRLGDEAGAGSNMKMINQLLAGVHIASAMEALALGIKSGLPAEKVFEVITASAGNSWMFENRVPHVLDNDYAPKSAVDIFVKDLGIVLETGKREGFPLPLSAVAHQQFLAAKGMGLGREDDAAVIKVFQALTGIDLPTGGE